jgi:uncharacterized membrane protein YdjX (TVP38/TMEM64 family)
LPSQYGSGGNPKQILVELSKERALLHAFVLQHSILAALIFVGAYAALMLLIWIPAAPCTIIGGLLFGVRLGVPYSVISSTLGAIGVFALGKSALGERISQNNALLYRLKDGFQKDALAYVAALRLMPAMPFGIIHVAAAYFDVPFSSFVLGTVLGMIPCIVIFSVLGVGLDSLIARGGGLNAQVFLKPDVVVPLTALAALALAPALIRRLRARR